MIVVYLFFTSLVMSDYVKGIDINGHDALYKVEF